MKYYVNKRVERTKSKTIAHVIGISSAMVLMAGFSMPALAAGGANNASACGTVHGAFNYQNTVYGSTAGPGNGVKGDSSGFGTGGGTPGAYGAVGQQAGATGYNNSHTGCQQ